MTTSPHCTPEKVQPAPSVFRETPLTPEQIANNLRDEIKRLKKRRQIAGPASPGSPPSPSSAPASPSSPSSPEPMMEMEAAACSSSSSSSTAGNGKPEKPIFTLKQMIMIADRMCEERVEQVRNEYDNILQQKLSEQVNTSVSLPQSVLLIFYSSVRCFRQVHRSSDPEEIHRVPGPQLPVIMERKIVKKIHSGVKILHCEAVLNL